METQAETPTDALRYFAQVAITAVARERFEQTELKGYTPHHDDLYRNNELGNAAACYAGIAGKAGQHTTQWPWDPSTFKPSHDKLNDLAKAGALILAAIEHECRNGTAIVPMVVLRDEWGHWTHPAWPVTDDEAGIPRSWFDERGLQVFETDFQTDAPEELVDAYIISGEPDCNAWKPSMPLSENGGWFIFSIHDTEDGPVCVWVRPQRLADSEKALADARLARTES
jgi:hypothetical protein